MEAVLPEGRIFHLIDFTNLYRTEAHTAKTAKPGRGGRYYRGYPEKKFSEGPKFFSLMDPAPRP